MYLADTFFLYIEHKFIHDFALRLEGQYNSIQIWRKLTDQLTTSLAKDEEEDKHPHCDKHLPHTVLAPNVHMCANPVFGRLELTFSVHLSETYPKSFSPTH